MPQEANVGQIFHTKDGKTVFIDPKTNQATVFNEVLTADQLIGEPEEGLISGGEMPDLAFQALASLLPAMAFMKPVKIDLFMLKKPGEPSQTEIDPLGPKQYYVLAPESAVPLSIGSSAIHAWVWEYQKGHKPVYEGHHKHRILAEQWDWLQAHKDCSIRAWYDQDQPGFVSLCCQDHALVMAPVTKPDKTNPLVTVSSATVESVQLQTDALTAEEREI